MKINKEIFLYENKYKLYMMFKIKMMFKINIYIYIIQTFVCYEKKIGLA